MRLFHFDRQVIVMHLIGVNFLVVLYKNITIKIIFLYKLFKYCRTLLCHKTDYEHIMIIYLMSYKQMWSIILQLNIKYFSNKVISKCAIDIL